MPTNTTDTLTIKLVNENISAQQAATAIGSTVIYSTSAFNPSFTSYNVEQDFNTPSDAFTFITEDGDQIKNIYENIYIGIHIGIYVNSNCIILGYIDNFDLVYNRNGGIRLTLTGRDLLGIAAQTHLLPNMGTSAATNFQFPATTTYQQAFSQIFQAGLYPVSNYNPQNAATFSPPVVMAANDASLSVISGGKIGLSVFRRTGRGLIKSINTAVNHLMKPDLRHTHTDTVLGYADKLAKSIGCKIKCAPINGIETIYINPPSYDREGATPYAITHLQNQPTQNNVIDGKIKIDYKNQPTVIIGQITHSDPQFRQQTYKVICVNEITGYQNLNGLVQANPTTGQDALQYTNLEKATVKSQVQYVIDQLTSGQVSSGATITTTVNNPSPSAQPTTTTTNIAPGYQILNPNMDLAKAYFSIQGSIMPFTLSPFNRMEYYEDTSAWTVDELQFAVAEKMADYQDQYLTLEYTVKGHTVNGAVWQPNVLCTVQDDITGLAPFSGTFWIQKVNFIRSRNEGCLTKLTLKLPYTHLSRTTK